MDKLTIATQVLLKLIETDKTGFDAEGIAAYSFEIADAMQAEAEKRESKERPDVLKEEWQPDWSKAPEWANWWAMDMDNSCYWYEDKLHLGDVEWDRYSIGKSFKSKPYGYTGNWKESLRKRPQ